MTTMIDRMNRVRQSGIDAMTSRMAELKAAGMHTYNEMHAYHAWTCNCNTIITELESGEYIPSSFMSVTDRLNEMMDKSARLHRSKSH